MDDSRAFETQLGRVLQEAAGPSRPTDVATVVRTVTTHSLAWRVRLLFSATKLVVAAAIVTLFGGLLLVGVLSTQRVDERAPAAVTDSPPPTTEELLSGMVTEEVEPGVFRVLNDGVRDLSLHRDGPFEVRTGQDGSVWFFDGEAGPFRLGDGRVYETDYDLFRSTRFRDAWFKHLDAIGPDGTIWTVTDDHALMAFDGDAARRYEAPDGGSFDQVVATRDGTIWATWRGGKGVVVGRLEGDTWRTVVAPFRPRPPSEGFANTFSVSDDGHIWLGGQRLDADGEDAVTVIADALGPNGIASDGTLWARARSLARVDGSGLTRYGRADGVPKMCCVGAGRPGEFIVAPDGSLWMMAQGGPSQSTLYHFDGSTWTPYRDGSGNIHVAPDGALWYVGGPPDGLYVIPPESPDG